MITNFLLARTRASGGLPAASRDGLTTGFTWVYFRRRHVGATAWLALAQRRANPYWLGGTVPAAAAPAGNGTLLSSLTAVPTRQGAQVVVTLTEPADLSVRILNVAGRLVREITCRKACDAGPQAVYWNGLADNGLPTPSGRFLVDITARGAGGTQTRGLAPLVER